MVSKNATLNYAKIILLCFHQQLVLERAFLNVKLLMIDKILFKILSFPSFISSREAGRIEGGKYSSRRLDSMLLASH